MSVRDLLRRVLRRVLPAPVRRAMGLALELRLRYRWHLGRVNRAYSTHYRDCRRRYAADGHVAGSSCGEVGVRVLHDGHAPQMVPWPSSYAALVARLSRDARERLSRTAGSHLHPPPVELAERTADTPAVQGGKVLIQKLYDPLDMDGLELLCEALLPILERDVYGSYIHVDKVYVSRTYTTDVRDGGSFQWHFDKHPRESLKLLIYLSDVTAACAPFTYLAREDGAAVRGRPSMTGRAVCREEEMAHWCAQGFVPRAALGPAGTCILFDDNVIHRATFASGGVRDALFLVLRPSGVARRPYVDHRWTGSLPHRDVSDDPEDIAPHLATEFSGKDYR